MSKRPPTRVAAPKPHVLDEVAQDETSHEETVFLRPGGLPGVEVMHASLVRHRYAPHTHNELTLALITRGAAAFDLGKVRHVAPSGRVIVIPPGQAHTGESATPVGYTSKVFYLDRQAVEDRVGAAAESSSKQTRVVLRDMELARWLASAHASLEHGEDEITADEAISAALTALRPLLTSYHEPSRADLPAAP